MEETEYNKRLKKIEAEYEQAKKNLYIEYAKSQEKYTVGDIIGDGTKIIKVDKITAYKGFGLPEPLYKGIELRKDLLPKKNGGRGEIYGNGQVILYKHSND